MLIYNCPEGGQRKKIKWCCRLKAAGRRNKMKKYCVKCGHEFEAAGREVICPACKEHAAAEAKRAAVLRTKRASWAGESVPVRISGRASTVIREYGTAHNVPFAAALDALLQSTQFFAELGMAWGDIVPYKSRRRDKSTTETAGKPQVASKTAGKQVTSKSSSRAKK